MTSSFWDDCIYRLKWIPCIYTYYLFRRQNVNFLSIKKSPFISCNGNIYIWDKIHSLSVKQKRSQHKTFKRRNVERYKQFFRCAFKLSAFHTTVLPFFQTIRGCTDKWVSDDPASLPVSFSSLVRSVFRGVGI